MPTDSEIDVNKTKGDPPTNRDESVKELGKYSEEILNNSDNLVDTSNFPVA